jgi:hypothetical protein
MGLCLFGAISSENVLKSLDNPFLGVGLLSGALGGGWAMRLYASLMDRRAARRAKAYSQASVELRSAIATNQEQPDTETVVAMNAITQELASVVKEKPKSFPRLRFDSCEAILSAVRHDTTEQ